MALLDGVRNTADDAYSVTASAGTTAYRWGTGRGLTHDNEDVDPWAPVDPDETYGLSDVLDGTKPWEFTPESEQPDGKRPEDIDFFHPTIAHYAGLVIAFLAAAVGISVVFGGDS